MPGKPFAVDELPDADVAAPPVVRLALYHGPCCLSRITGTTLLSIVRRHGDRINIQHSVRPPIVDAGLDLSGQASGTAQIMRPALVSL
jgi:hypothetical protein